MMAVLREGTHTARKRHFCDSCCGTIEAGERYYTQVSDDTGFGQFKAHERCRRASEIVFNAAPEWHCLDEMPAVSDFDSEDWDIVLAEDESLFAQFAKDTPNAGN